jgi:hypothetical protein
MEVRVRISVSGPLLTGKAESIIKAQQEAAITEMIMFLLPKIKALTPQGVYGAQGGLLESIQPDLATKGMPVFKGVIATDSKYGVVVEKGRLAGKGIPPKFLGDGTTLTIGRWLEVKLGLSAKEAQRIEFVVRRKIGQKGFPGAHMFEKGLNDNWSMLQTIAQNYGLQLAKELTGKV